MLETIKTIVIFVHLGVSCFGSVRHGWPGYEHYPELQGWLKVHQEPADWKTARTNCHNEAALLASPWTAKFTSTINRLQSTTYSSLPILYSGVGLRSGSAGLQMEPCDNKRCPVFLADGTADKVTCDQRLPYACFASESACGDQYEFNHQTGQCYKFHGEGATVPTAKVICQGEGGYLAKINDDTEKAVLEAISDGLSFIDNDDGGPAYRHLFNHGYSDYSCSASHAFICEKSNDKKWTESLSELAKWVASGQLKAREHFTEGFENIIDAFVGTLNDETYGKAFVKVYGLVCSI